MAQYDTKSLEFFDYFPNLRHVLSHFLGPKKLERENSIDAFIFSGNLSEVACLIDQDVWVLVDANLATSNASHGFEEICTARGSKWFRLCGGEKLQKEKPDLYIKLKHKVKLTNHAEEEIRKDVCRTSRQMELWTAKNRKMKQEQVFNVLKVYSCYLNQVGYCQGMGCVCAVLLNELSEECTFWTMVALTVNSKYKLWGVWHPTMPLVHEIFLNMERLVEKKFPQLSKHFKQQGVITCTMYGVCTWFITIFAATKLPLNLLYDIWDAYFEHGLPVIYKIGLGILDHSHDDLLKKDFDKILYSFQEEFFQIKDSEHFVKNCVKMFDIPEFKYKFPFKSQNLVQVLTEKQ